MKISTIFLYEELKLSKEVSSCTKQEIESMNDKEIRDASFVIDIEPEPRLVKEISGRWRQLSWIRSTQKAAILAIWIEFWI